MKIRQRIPNFVDGVTPKQDTFETCEELLNLEWVKNWDTIDSDEIPFWRYSESKHGDEYLLMAEYKNGKNHKSWVIGYMSCSVGLPEYKTS